MDGLLVTHQRTWLLPLKKSEHDHQDTVLKQAILEKIGGYFVVQDVEAGAQSRINESTHVRI